MERTNVKTELYVIGLIFLIYGLLKVIVVAAILFFIPKDVQMKLAKVPALNLLITGDTTIAGKGGEIALGMFGIFSIIHGLALMGYTPSSVTRVFESKWFQYLIYLVFGLAFIIFYSLVLYTDLPIPKKEENRRLYWTYAYLGGASFLVVPIIWELSIHVIPYMSTLTLREQLAYITVIILILIVAAYIIRSFIPKDL